MQSYGDDPFIPPDQRHARSATSADAYFYVVLRAGRRSASRCSLRGGDRRRLLLLLSIVAVVISVWPFFGDPRFHVPINVLMPDPGRAMVLVARRAPARAAVAASE